MFFFHAGISTFCNISAHFTIDVESKVLDLVGDMVEEILNCILLFLTVFLRNWVWMNLLVSIVVNFAKFAASVQQYKLEKLMWYSSRNQSVSAFITYTTARHRGVIKMFWLHFWGTVLSPVFHEANIFTWTAWVVESFKGPARRI